KIEIPPKGEIPALQAIADAKGLSKWANPKLAYVLKKDPKTEKYTKLKLNLEAGYKDLSSKANIILSKDDMIVIPSLAEGAVAPEATQVMVAGKVNKPGVVLFEPGEQGTLVRAILKAGNFNKFANKSKVRIIRRVKGKNIAISVNIKELLEAGKISNDIKLLSGDLIIIDDSWY
ncbi:MAG: SLBB domain-containing protein, partial [Lentisphaeria bacterium]|nr:SLBB domain-containing protein [Lentisphaeria bacterium]NQZ70523.1 SLBB domain-containing protein [Lentisphaeria bacterium]